MIMFKGALKFIKMTFNIFEQNQFLSKWKDNGKKINKPKFKITIKDNQF